MQSSYTSTNTEPSTELVKSKTVWFEDGNIILQAKSTLFRVYQGILKVHSSVFADMFSIPRSEEQDTYDGYPVVILLDDVWDLEYFLLALYNSSTLSRVQKPSFRHIAALCRLGTKYDVPHIRQYAVRLLRAAYPVLYHEYSKVFHDLLQHNLDAPFDDDITGSSFEAVNIGLQLNIPDIVPAAMCSAATLSMHRIISGVTSTLYGTHYELEGPSKALCFRVHCTLQAEKTFLFGYLFEPPVDGQCLNPTECAGARRLLLHKHMLSWKHALRIEWDIRDSESLCNGCRQGFYQSFANRREQIWEKLPGLCGLGDWEKLMLTRGQA